MKLYAIYKNQKKEILQQAINKSQYLKSLISFYGKDQTEIELDLDVEFVDAEKIFKIFTEKSPFLTIGPCQETLEYFGMKYKPLLTKQVGNNVHIDVSKNNSGLEVLVYHGSEDSFISNDAQSTFISSPAPKYSNFSKIQTICPIDLQTSLSVKFKGTRQVDLYKPMYFRLICEKSDDFKISDYIDQFSFIASDGELISTLNGEFLDHYNNMTHNLLLDVDETDNSMEVSFKIPIIANSSHIYCVREQYSQVSFYVKAKQCPKEFYVVFSGIYLDMSERKSVLDSTNIETIYNTYIQYTLKNTTTLDLVELTNHKISSLFFYTKNKVIGMHLRNKITKDVYFTYDKLSMTTIIPFAFMKKETPEGYYYIDFSCYQANTEDNYNNLGDSPNNNNFTNIISGNYCIKKNCELVFDIEDDIDDCNINIYIKKECIYSQYEI